MESREEAFLRAALELPADKRPAFLDVVCAGNEALRAKLESEIASPEKPPAAGTIKIELGGIEDEGVGKTIGHYKLLEKIGEGGCGTVYIADQTEPVRRRVALKVIKLGMDTKEVVARFEVERQALAIMDHPNIAKVFDAGTTASGRPYFVMELVKGTKITDYCDQHQLSTRDRLALFTQVCSAVQHAHQKGIIHRDIKPGNILVAVHDNRAVPKVIDFGIAKATQGTLTDKTVYTELQQFMGTPAYMSPEQAEMSSLDIDTRSDIYSLGVVLYELLTGRTPFTQEQLLSAGVDEMRRIIREKEPLAPSTQLHTLSRDEQTTVARRHGTEPPRLMHSVRGDLDWIVMRALDKDRTRRYETANGLAMDLERHLKNEPVMARPPSAFYLLQKTIRRHKLAWAAAASVMVTLVLGIVASTHEAIRAWRAEREQSHLRNVADSATTEARADSLRAVAAAEDVKVALAKSDFLEACRLIEADDGPDAVAYLSRCLTIQPDNKAALARLASLLTYNTWMVPTVELKQGAPITYAQFSPDGQLVATASHDCSARVWDARTGRAISPPLKHQAEVWYVQFSLDGKRIATASDDGMVRIWEAATGKPLAGPLEHRGKVSFVQFSRDGKRLVTACDNAARIWEVATGQPAAPALVHNGPVNTARFSPNGRLVVTASADRTAFVWDIRTGKPVAGPFQHGASVRSAEFSPDGTRIVTASHDSTARVWDVHSGQPLTPPIKLGGWAESAVFSPNGKWILTASRDGVARVWDASSGSLLISPLRQPDNVNSAQFSPDGSRIIAVCADGSVRVWDARTGEPAAEPLMHAEQVSYAEFSPDGKRILTASDTARIWDAEAEPPNPERLKLTARITAADFSPNGKRVVTACADGTGQIWDSETGALLANSIKHAESIRSAEFSPDGQYVVTASEDGTARVWDAQTSQPRTGPLKHDDIVMAAHFSSDGKRVVTASRDNTARVWDAATGQPLTKPLNHRGQVFTAEFSPDNTRVVTASGDFTARVWDAMTGEPVTSGMFANAEVYDAEFAPDGRSVVTASRNNMAQIWDARTGRLIGSPFHHGNWVHTAQFSPDGNRVLTVAGPDGAGVWDAHTGQQLLEISGHGGAISAARFSPDGQRIATSSVTGMIRIWDTQSGKPLSEPLKQTGSSPRFSPDGNRLIEMVWSGASIWDVSSALRKCPGWLLSNGECLAGRRINKEGILEETSLDRMATLAQARDELAKLPDDGDGMSWGRWLLADHSTRTVSPYSKLPASSGGVAQKSEQLKRPPPGAGETVSPELGRFRRAASLQQEALQLLDAGKAGEAEAKYREALQAAEVAWPGESYKWTDYLRGLVNVLKQEGKEGEVEALYDDLLSSGNADSDERAPILAQRGDDLEFAGKFDDAKSLYSKHVEGTSLVAGLAQFRLGILYEKGAGANRDKMAALNLFVRSAASAYHCGSDEAVNALAWLLATSENKEYRNGTNAVRLAKDAVEASSGTNAVFLGTLAAAYAEAGEFDQAAATQTLAMRLLHDSAYRWHTKAKPADANGCIDRVCIFPARPQLGGQILISYDPNGGPIPHPTQVSAHLGWNEWSPTQRPDVPMTFVESSNCWQCSVVVPFSAGQLNCCFHDNGNVWDNNDHQDWNFAISSLYDGGEPSEEKYASRLKLYEAHKPYHAN